jgi:H+/Cl- antiporter ClcA
MAGPPSEETAGWLVRRQPATRRNRGERRLLLLVFFECLICLFIWWCGVVIALGNQPQHRHWDMVQQQRRADWVSNELEQRPWWWLMLSALMLLVLADWLVDKWAQRPWRAAILWTIGMSIVLVVVVALTEHFGWGIKPIRL